MAVVAVEDVEVLVVIVVEAGDVVEMVLGPVAAVVPGPFEVGVVEDVEGPLVPAASDVVVSPVATMDVSGRSVTSAPAAFTAT